MPDNPAMWEDYWRREEQARMRELVECMSYMGSSMNMFSDMLTVDNQNQVLAEDKPETRMIPIPSNSERQLIPHPLYSNNNHVGANASEGKAEVPNLRPG